MNYDQVCSARTCGPNYATPESRPVSRTERKSWQEQITFRWKDYRQHDKQKLMTLTATEFIRRFLLHLLPSGFQRICHFGFLGNRYRQAKLALCRHLLAMARSAPVSTLCRDYRDRYEQLTGKSLRVCPVCAQGQMTRVETLPARADVPGLGWDSS